MDGEQNAGLMIRTVLSVIVIVVMVAAVAIPVISGMAVDTETGTNDSETYMMSDTAGTDVTIELTDGNISVNGNVMPLSGQDWVVWSESFLVFNPGTSTSGLTSLGIYTGAAYINQNITAVTISGGTYSVTGTGSAAGLSGSISGTMLYYNPEGTYGFFKNGLTSNADAPVYGYVYRDFTPTSGSAERIIFTYSGTFEGITIHSFYNLAQQNNVHDLTAAIRYTENEDGTITVENRLDTGGTVNGSAGSITGTSIFFIAPLEYKIYSDKEGTVWTIVNIIPVMLVVLALMVAMGGIVYWRR